jgi:hypothetical protein
MVAPRRLVALRPCLPCLPASTLLAEEGGETPQEQPDADLERSKDLVARLDRDGDGRLYRRGFPPMGRRAFRRIDADGFVTAEENAP